MEDTYGLGNPLADPKDAKVDIVFVHGLHGNRVTTWTADASDENPQSVYWPKDLLPSKCPNARILSFGYNASIAHFYPLFGPKDVAPTTTINNHSSLLLDQLVGLRTRTESTDRPLIFVAHSLGGLVCANAISRQLGVDAAKEHLVTKVCGMVFLGTPFAGAKQARWARIASKMMSIISTTNPGLSGDLEERSKTLIDICDHFNKLIKARDRTPPYIELACYVESLPTYVKKKCMGIIVDEHSATLPGIEPIIIEKNHSGIAKFDGPYRQGFISISDILLKWIQNLDRATETQTAAGGINIGATNYHAPVSRNQGIVTGTVFSDKERGISMIGSKRTYHGSRRSQSSSDRSNDDGD